MLVFIDESGDPGFKVAKGSSPTFVVALVAFKQVEQSAAAQAAIDKVALEHKIGGEFKFSQSRPAVRDAFFRELASVDFCIRAIIVRKERLYSTHLRTDKAAFYSFFVKSMLKFDGGLLRHAKVVIDGSGDSAFKRELSTYLKRHTGENAIKSVRFSNSKNDRLVQMADMCTGAIARSCRNDRTDAKRWHNMLSSKIEDIWDYR